MSLGSWCSAKWQADRLYGRQIAPSSIFDFQHTPPSAACLYLDRDFQGMFERSDLVPYEGRVLNERYGTRHFHEFPSGADHSTIDLHYREARKRHDYLCKKARGALLDGIPTVFLFSHPVARDERDELIGRIRRLSPARPFSVIEAPDRDVPPTRAGNDAWMGNDEAWEKALAIKTIVPPASRSFDVVGPARVQIARLWRHLSSMRF